MNQSHKDDFCRLISNHEAAGAVILDVKQDLFLRWVKASDDERAEIALIVNALDLVIGKIAQIYANSEDINQ